MYASEYGSDKPSVHRRRRRRRRSCRILYILNVLMLIFAAVRIFGGSDETMKQENGFLTEAGAVMEYSDTAAPVISGVKDITVYAGDAVAYRSGVTVTDSQDAAPTLEIDSSKVDLTCPGSYEVTYRAMDATGNTAAETAVVTVLEKQAGFVSMETIQKAVDEKLEEILSDDMSPREQVQAIYTWAKSSLDYGGSSLREDWMQAGYEMLTMGSGDCYGYFAVTKLMFQRLEIPNLDVEKKKRSADDSEHFWSLVSVDGGETWYHFDATPRVGQTEELCMVTDTFLDSFDTYHDDCHNRDKSLYPATPEGWS